MIKKYLKNVVLPDARYLLDRARSQNAMCIYLISDGINFTSEQQFYPFYFYGDEIRSKYNIIFRYLHLARIESITAEVLDGADAIFYKLSYLTPYEKVKTISEQLRRSAKDKPLVYFDGDDDSNILWPDIIQFVDLYVKKHMFNDPLDYQTGFVGKNNLTDYVAKTYGISFSENVFPKTDRVPEQYLSKVSLAYNIALDKKILNLFARTKDSWANFDRSKDIVCRATTDSWHKYLRQLSEPLDPLVEKYNVLVPTELVSQEEYDSEMANSKICISPFGYGEICWRDFESVLWGCLMIKQEMGHIKTVPNIYIPYETYVPVKWDFSDLAEKCEYYLENSEERTRIVNNAYSTLSKFYEEKGFLRIFEDILSKISANPKSNSNAVFKQG